MPEYTYYSIKSTVAALNSTIAAEEATGAEYVSHSAQEYHVTGNSDQYGAPEYEVSAVLVVFRRPIDTKTT